MVNNYEIIEYFEKLPMRIFIHSINRLNLHWHREMETLLVLEGSISLIVDGVHHILHKGELIVINSNQIHYTEHTEVNNQVLLMQVDISKLNILGIPNTLFFSCIGNGDTNYHIAILRSCLSNIMLKMLNKQESAAFQCEIYSYLFYFLEQLLRFFSIDDSESTHLRLKEQDIDRMDKIMSYIDNNYEKKLTLEEIANRVYLSPNHLTCFLKNIIGMSFQQYVNLVRGKYLIDRLDEDLDKPLEILYQQCGFSSAQYAIKVFRELYQMTPSEYRKRQQMGKQLRTIADHMKIERGYLPTYQTVNTELLEKYANQNVLKKEIRTIKENQYIENIEIDVSKTCASASYQCALKMTSIGRAYEGLQSEVQQQLICIQQELKFSYIRFHGIFNDEMMIVKPDNRGNLTYSWHMIDRFFDFLLKIGLRPYIDLTCMPSCIAAGEETVFYWKGNISKPRDMTLWCELVQKFLIHCIQRYGYTEVEKWYIEVWNEPDLSVFWKGTMQEYFIFYSETAQAVKQILPTLKIGGPSISAMGVYGGEWLVKFIQYCKSGQIPLDFISFHVYPEIMEVFNEEVSSDEVKLLYRNYMEEICQKAEDQSDGLPLIVSEWNITIMDNNPVNDCAYAATAMLCSIFCQNHMPDILAHWTALDNYDERFHRDEEFHGGFGLMTYHGIRKMSYWAIWCLRKMGNQVIYRSEHALITKSKEGIQLLIINHPYHNLAYDLATVQKKTSALDERLILRFFISNCSGCFIKNTYTFSSENNPMEVAGRSGLNQLIAEDEAKYISSKSLPAFEKITVDALNSLAFTVELNPCEFQLILLVRK